MCLQDPFVAVQSHNVTVRMRPFQQGKIVWEQATVAKRHDERSYEVETEKGAYRRNRADLREQPIPQRSPERTPLVQQTSEQTPSDTPNKNQEKIQAGANSTQEASVQSGSSRGPISK